MFYGQFWCFLQVSHHCLNVPHLYLLLLTIKTDWKCIFNFTISSKHRVWQVGSSKDDHPAWTSATWPWHLSKDGFLSFPPGIWAEARTSMTKRLCWKQQGTSPGVTLNWPSLFCLLPPGTVAMENFQVTLLERAAMLRSIGHVSKGYSHMGIPSIQLLDDSSPRHHLMAATGEIPSEDLPAEPH